MTAEKQKETRQGPDLPCKTSERKDRGASTLCVTPARLHGRARLSGRAYYYGFVAENQRNLTLHITIASTLWGHPPRLPLSEAEGAVHRAHLDAFPRSPPSGLPAAGLTINQCVVSFCRFCLSAP